MPNTPARRIDEDKKPTYYRYELPEKHRRQPLAPI